MTHLLHEWGVPSALLKLGQQLIRHGLDFVLISTFFTAPTLLIGAHATAGKVWRLQRLKRDTDGWILECGYQKADLGTQDVGLVSCRRAPSMVWGREAQAAGPPRRGNAHRRDAGFQRMGTARLGSQAVGVWIPDSHFLALWCWRFTLLLWHFFMYKMRTVIYFTWLLQKPNIIMKCWTKWFSKIHHLAEKRRRAGRGDNEGSRVGGHSGKAWALEIFLHSPL